MKLLKTLLIILILLIQAGCLPSKEYVKIPLGTSTYELEKIRKDAIAAEFKIPHDEAFKKIQEILKTGGCSIFYKNHKKKVLVAMEFKGFINTSQAGIFLTKINQSETKVEITSQSQNLAKEASKIIFPALEKIQEKK